MKEITFRGVPESEQFKHLEQNDGVDDGTTVRDPALVRCLLRDKYLRKVRIVGGRMQHCRFERTNLRDARLERVDLTGSVFVECNLQHATFDRCKLWYVTFERTQIDYSNILDSLPDEPNLRRQLLQSLRANAQSLGDNQRANLLHVLELSAERHELANIVIGATPHYRERYSAWARIQALGALGSWWMQRLVWGHGLALWNVALFGAVTVLTFALLCVLTPAAYVVRSAAPRQLTFPEALYYSLISFTTGGFGDILPGNDWARLITGAEGLFGVVFLAFFAAAAYRRLGR